MVFLDFLFGKKKQQTSIPEFTIQNNPKPNTYSPSVEPSISTNSQRHSKHTLYTFDIKKLQGVDLGGGFTLVPLDMGLFTNKKFPMFVTLAHSTPNIEQWLPGFDLSTPESAVRYLRACILRTEMGLGFTYLIKIRGGIVGMFFVNTPGYNETTIGFPHWSIDFFLIGMVQGQGLMPKMLLGFFFYLKEVLKLPEIYSIVDLHNLQCVKMLDKCSFFQKNKNMVFTDPSTGNKAVAYCCSLQNLKNPF